MSCVWRLGDKVMCFSHWPCLVCFKRDLMSAVHLVQREHNNHMVRAETPIWRMVWGRGLGTPIKLWCGSFLVQKLHNLRPTQLRGVQHMLELRGFRSSLDNAFSVMKEHINMERESKAGSHRQMTPCCFIYKLFSVSKMVQTNNIE